MQSMTSPIPRHLKVQPRQIERAPSDSVSEAVQMPFYHHIVHESYLRSYLVTVDHEYVTKERI